MRSNGIIRGTVAFVIGASLFAPASARAQLANASAATLGLAGNATATARGLAALSVNPAGLGMPGSGFSLAFIPLQIRSGIDPITLKDIKEFEGIVLPEATKEEWLQRAAASGGQSGSVGVDVSEIALTVGRFGLQVSTLAAANLNLAPDVVELLLFGNAGRTGTPADISLRGSTASGFAVTTAGVSFGIPLSSEEGAMAFGATVKYSVGHVVAAGRDQGGSVTSDPVKLDLRFPVVSYNDSTTEFDIGSGVGVDLGFQMKRGRMSLGGAVLNLFSTFKWNDAKLVYRPVTVLFDGDSSATDTDRQPISRAPAGVAQMVTDMKFDPVLSVGAGYDVSDVFTVSADLRNRFGDGMDITPKLHLGAGAEFRGIEALHLRAGVAIITDGVELGGGTSLVLGPVSLSAAAAIRRGNLDNTTLGQFTLSFGGR